MIFMGGAESEREEQQFRKTLVSALLYVFFFDVLEVRHCNYSRETSRKKKKGNKAREKNDL